MCDEFISELQAESQMQLLTCKEQLASRTPQNDILILKTAFILIETATAGPS